MGHICQVAVVIEPVCSGWRSFHGMDNILSQISKNSRAICSKLSTKKSASSFDKNHGRLYHQNIVMKTINTCQYVIVLYQLGADELNDVFAAAGVRDSDDSTISFPRNRPLPRISPTKSCHNRSVCNLWKCSLR
jgi:hypothetical protein